MREEHRRQAVIASAQEQISHVVDHLIEDDDSEMKVMSILRGQDARNVLLGADAPPALTPDALAGPFGHIVVDEAQELTDAEWRMLVARCPSRSFTVVGDRAQARQGFTETWEERLMRIGLRDVRITHLGVNYRTPAEVMATAAPLVLAAIPTRTCRRRCERAAFRCASAKPHHCRRCCTPGSTRIPTAWRASSATPASHRGKGYGR